MANRIQHMLYGAGVGAIGLALALASAPLAAAPGTLSKVPLFATTSTPPNIVLIIDDSGSMDSEVIFFTNDAALWWNTTTPVWSTATPPALTTRGRTFVGVDGPYGPAITGQVSFNRSGAANATWKKYVYLFPNGTGTGKRVYADSDNDHYAVPPLPQYAFARSPDYNASYFDPDTTYDPWPSYGTTTYSDITATSAPSDPYSGTSATLNLTTNRQSDGGNETFKMFNGMTVTNGAYYKIGAAAWGTASSDVAITTTSDVAIRYYPATYYLTLIRALGTTVPTGSYTYTITYSTGGTPATASVSGDCASPSSAHYDLFHRSPGGFAASPSSVSGHNIIGLAPDGQCLVEYQIAAATTQMQNFANWFGYYRKRHLALRGGIVSAFENVTGIRAGVYTINNSVTALLPPLDVTTVGSTNQNTFFSKVFSIDGNSAGTPNRAALDAIGRQYQIAVGGTGAMVLPQSEGGHCQKNFAIQFTDGFSTLTTEGVGNADNGAGAPYQDSYSETLADIAMYYYNTNLQSSLPYGKVPVLPVCPATTSCTVTDCRSVSTTNPAADCNRNPHMNTITVGIGAYGTIFNSPLTTPPFFYQTVANAHTTPPTWPNVNVERDPTQLDDLYHAAVNGRGEIYNARTPAALTTAMQNAVKTIFAQVGAASAVTFNTSRLTAANTVFLSLFNAADWSGDVQAYDLTALTNSAISGTTSPTPLWKAATVLDARATERVILTYNSGGVSFRWSSLSSAQQADLRVNPAGGTDADAVAQARLDYLRGNRSNEGTGLKFRIRGSRLGDIVYSNAVYVPAPSSGQPSMIYVGANDGMLHGFCAEPTGSTVCTPGTELLAYIPGHLFSTTTNGGLHYLTDPAYQHRFYVDLSPVVAKVGSKTILIGGDRAGGRGYFALDVSSPNTFSETNASSIVLWEFTNADDSDLGYTFSAPTVAQLNSGTSASPQWGAIFGNGYDSDGGVAKLFIVLLDSSGAKTGYLELSTQSGTSTDKNGLSTPGVVDLNFDGKADRVYAGDVKGKLWVFDISNSSSTSWDVAYKDGTTPVALFAAASNQPITVEPIIAKNAAVTDTTGNQPNVLALFGTGQYLADGDSTTTSTQSFYGVWDNGTARTTRTTALTRANLVSQTIALSSDGNSRAITTAAVNYATAYGWYIDLPTSRERVVASAMVRAGTVLFNTLIPSTDRCSYGGDGWLMAVDLKTGGGTVDSSGNAKPVFDRNGDLALDNSDLCYVASGTLTCPTGSGTTPPTGSTSLASAGQKFSDHGGSSLGLPAESSFTTAYQYTPGTKTTDGSTVNVRKVEEYRGGRLTWQELLGD